MLTGPQRRKLHQLSQPLPRNSWDVTETEPDGTYDEAWNSSRYKHRKFVGLIDKDVLRQLIDNQILDWCGCDTMGALGTMSPDGMTIGMMPAISFRNRDDDSELDAYITPYVCKSDGLTPVGHPDLMERNWDRVNSAFIARYAEAYRKREGPYSRARRLRLQRESALASAGQVFPDRG